MDDGNKILNTCQELSDDLILASLQELLEFVEVREVNRYVRMLVEEGTLSRDGEKRWAAIVGKLLEEEDGQDE